MLKQKTITMRYHGCNHKAYISSDMTQDELYQALYDGISNTVGAYDIVLYDPTRGPNGQKTHLAFTELHQGRVYTVQTTGVRVQGAGTGSLGSQRVASNLTYIRANWGLQQNEDIFARYKSMAPRVRYGSHSLATTSAAEVQDPVKWSRRFTQELCKFSGKTRGEYEEGMQLLAREVEKRQQIGDDNDDEGVVLEVTTMDIVNALKERAWLVKEGPQEQKANKVFAGGLYEAVEQAEESDGGALVGSQYEQDGKFNIALR
jgi:hypothetical protein